jgi:hypothetical protein
MTLEDAVRQTRDLWRSSALIWGVSDCMISCADYALLRTGSDPAAIWRGCYTTREGALEIIAHAGGVVRLMGLGLATVGARPIAEPARGDLVCATIGGDEIGGLCLGDVITFRRPSGAIELPKRLLKISGAWAL